MNRLLELPPEQQTPEQKKVFEQLVAGRGRILGPYKIWIHSPTVASGMEHIGTYLNKKGSLSEREVEIGILVIAQHWDADYVRQAHIKMGKQVGLSQEIIDAVLAGRDPKLTDPHERAVHRFAAALVAGAKLSGCGVRRDREGDRPRRRRRGAGAARLLHLGRARHEGARGADPAAVIERCGRFYALRFSIRPGQTKRLAAGENTMTHCFATSRRLLPPPAVLAAGATAQIAAAPRHADVRGRCRPGRRCRRNGSSAMPPASPSTHRTMSTCCTGRAR